MILADENIDFNIIKALRSSSIEVYSIGESHSGISDEQVIGLSVNPPRIILTEDKDFGEWVYAHKIVDISVIFLRYEFKETSKITAILIDLIQTQKEKLFGKFTTITIDKIRIRSLK